MSLKEARSMYQKMLEDGELEMLLPHSTGEWKTDKRHFMEMYELHNSFISIDSINLDENDIEDTSQDDIYDF